MSFSPTLISVHYREYAGSTDMYNHSCILSGVWIWYRMYFSDIMKKFTCTRLLLNTKNLWFYFVTSKIKFLASLKFYYHGHRVLRQLYLNSVNLYPIGARCPYMGSKHIRVRPVYKSNTGQCPQKTKTGDYPGNNQYCLIK